MRTMQALVMHAVGEPVDILRLETRPVPEPDAGQVRVRVQAAPIHATDLHILRGRYGFAPELPAVLGVECVGVVADQTIRIPEGQPMPLPDFADAVRMADASGHGGKPLLALAEG